MKKHKTTILYYVLVALCLSIGISLCIAGYFVKDHPAEEEKDPFALSYAVNLVEYLSIEDSDKVSFIECFGRGNTYYFKISYKQVEYFSVIGPNVKKINVLLYDVIYNQMSASDITDSTTFGTERTFFKHVYSRSDIEKVFEEVKGE